VLISRIAYLILKENIFSDKILAVTFTKKAAEEMKTRLGVLLQKSNVKNPPSLHGTSLSTRDTGSSVGARRKTFSSGVTCTTLHSFCTGILRSYDVINPDFTIYDDADSMKIIAALMKEKKVFDEDGVAVSARAVYGALSTIKRQMLKRIGYQFVDPVFQIANDLMRDYNQVLRDNNARDFDDLILDTLNILLRNGPAAHSLRAQYSHVLCDEWQDVDKSQYCLLTLLTDDSRRRLHFGPDIDNYVRVNNLFEIKSKDKEEDDTQIGRNVVNDPEIEQRPRTLFVVGDSFQTIYSWRGADNKNMDYFATDFPG
jgi:DNA helicase II / ATP-dependent DNA helicase PcrA